jgi:hypothetical protein
MRLRVVGLSHSHGTGVTLVEVEIDGLRHELAAYVDADSVMLRVRSISTPEVAPFVLIGARPVGGTTWATVGPEGRTVRLEGESRIERAIDADGEILPTTDPDLIRERVEHNANGEALHRMFSDPTFSERLEAFASGYVNAPPGTARFNPLDFICGGAAIGAAIHIATAGAGAPITATLTMLCGTMHLLRSFELYYCPDDIDCDGIPDTEEEPSDPWTSYGGHYGPNGAGYYP